MSPDEGGTGTVGNAQGVPQSRGAASPTDTVAAGTVTSHFKLVFISVLILEVALLIAMNGMAFAVAEPNETLQNSISTCATLATAGFGAICGLIGGKAIT